MQYGQSAAENDESHQRRGHRHYEKVRAYIYKYGNIRQHVECRVRNFKMIGFKLEVLYRNDFFQFCYFKHINQLQSKHTATEVTRLHK